MRRKLAVQKGREIERLENELKMVAYHLTKDGTTGSNLESHVQREIEDISDVHQMTNAQLKRIIQKIKWTRMVM